MQGKSGFHALIEAKCPQCRKGEMFVHNALSVSKFDKMHSHCSNCNFRFEVEPGFFIGAMYVSYAMVIALMFVATVLLYVLANPPNWVYCISFPFLIILFLPFIFRYSRVFYLYAFGGVSYREKL